MRSISRCCASSVAAMAVRSSSRRRCSRAICFYGSCAVGGTHAGRRAWFASSWMGQIPAHVPDAVISEIRSRERGGFVELPKLHGLKPGMRVKVLQGPLQDQIGLLAALRPHERVLVLLQLLGGQQRVELAQSSVEAINP